MIHHIITETLETGYDPAKPAKKTKTASYNAHEGDYSGLGEYYGDSYIPVSGDND